MAKLSDVFSRLGTRPGNSVPTSDKSRARRVSNQQATGKTNRNAKVAQARGIKPSNNAPKGANVRRNPAKGGNKNANRKGGRNPKGKGKRPAKKDTPASKESLDMDMDKYWHKAGKGPDPEMANLDRQMDSYFGNKKTEAPAESS